MAALGGAGEWGAVYENELHLDPGVFADRLTREAVWLLNELMKHMPVERLPGVALSDADGLPPPSRPGDIGDDFAPWVRKSVRWQLGI